MTSRSHGPPVVILIGPEDKEHVVATQNGLAPRLDYRLVAERVAGGRVQEMRPTSAQLAGSKAVRVLRSQGANLIAALQLLRTLPEDAVLYATAEVWGLPISLAAAMLRRRRHTIVWQVHQIWSPSWLWLLRILHPVLRVDGWICQTDHQSHLLRRMLRNRTTPVRSISQGVDAGFFKPPDSPASVQSPYILAVGAEERNYPLLLQAAARLESQVIIHASSAWIAAGKIAPGAIPANVRMQNQRLSYVDLRALYDGANAVVIPLYDTPVAAGITSVLEAMAMNKPVVATRSAGLPDLLVDGVTGRIVEPEAGALAAALAAESERETMAARAYAAVQAQYTIEAHAAQVAGFLEQLVAARGVGASAR
jgi:glycosyltransferase involved in cell wall biosynthesis